MIIETTTKIGDGIQTKRHEFKATKPLASLELEVSYAVHGQLIAVVAEVIKDPSNKYYLEHNVLFMGSVVSARVVQEE